MPNGNVGVHEREYGQAARQRGNGKVGYTMKAAELYDHLEHDFISEGLWDRWAEHMGEIEGYLSPNFIKRSMGLVCDFATDVNKVYSAVFPSEDVMGRVLAEGATDAMLFVHHAAVWDIRRPSAFYQMDRKSLERLKGNRVSVYNLHVPLDDFGEYSTTKTLADALGIEVERPFFDYCGALAGIIGRIGCRSVEELHRVFSETLGHQTRLYPYGDSVIPDGRVAVVAGGGNDLAVVSEMLENNVKTLVTGITANNDVSAKVHAFEQKSRINVLGGTHYSTEKFACIKMCAYFERLELPSVFIEEEPLFEDM
ncbi:MAG: Nif3-like dinuclear metal center hexameric protein [Coriobacteriia bacterium]|nr:Nif3-like dinuclear metal center hexameric protein [Coriobacteriia bacterium]